MPYTYTELATPTTIRLIQVMPERINDAIACTIHTYEAEQVQQETYENIGYRALSYRWGDPKCTRHVFLRDSGKSEWHQHPLHENLWRFIDHAWEHRLFGQHFWTDYFCLDQNSVEEKAQQIPRMGGIYAGAIETIIWLGLSESHAHQLESLLKWPPYPGRRSIRPPKGADQMVADAVKALWRNEYWSRVWIVQEVVLAKRNTVMVGSVSISLDDLRRAILYAKPTRDQWQHPSITELANL
ncbi:hypothetical protein diail_857, partial [Diaporthe ilicicola]